MSKKSRKLNQSPEKAPSKEQRFFIGLVVVGITAVLAYAGFNFYKRHSKQFASKSFKVDSTTPKSISDLVKMSPDQLEKVDIGLMNLFCAESLRGAEDLDLEIPQLVTFLDNWANRVDSETKRSYHKFLENRQDFNNSEAYYRMMAMVTILEQDMGIHYNPARIHSPTEFESNDIFFADSNDVFINGLLKKHTGTCSSMPVFYVAIGRRLGYPLKLVTTKGHLFVRWDNGTERLNIEATSEGMVTRSDDYYKTWPFPVSDEEIKREGYLKSLSAAEELAVFLSTRGCCLLSMAKPIEALNCFNAASRLSPQSTEYKLMAADAQRRRERTSKGRIALMPPELQVHIVGLTDPQEIQAEIADHNAEMNKKHGNSPAQLPLQIQPTSVKNSSQ